MSKLVKDLMKYTASRSKASAVREAVQEYLRREKIEEIKSKKGKLKFDLSAEKIRHHER